MKAIELNDINIFNHIAIVYIRDILGHTSTQTTDIYASGIPYVDDYFYGDVNRFVIHRNKHKNNLLTYYNLASLKLRKKKLTQLNEKSR
jgi:hypothetical protein